MLDLCRSRWSNINPASGEHLVFGEKGVVSDKTVLSFGFISFLFVTDKADKAANLCFLIVLLSVLRVLAIASSERQNKFIHSIRIY